MKKEDQNEPRKGQWDHYIKVNGTYYKKVACKEPSGKTAVNLIATSVATIKEDLRHSNILMIPQYNGFTNVPENDPDKYQRVFSVREIGIDTLLYNLYSPVNFNPTDGEYNNIDKVLRHLFDGDNYEKAILYLKNLYMHPAMRQPIICLFGGQSTGKTTFLHLLKAIYDENMRLLDFERIRSKFNYSWAGKLIIGVDEAFCDDNDLQTVKFCLKSIQTNDTITIKRKGAD